MKTHFYLAGFLLLLGTQSVSAQPKKDSLPPVQQRARVAVIVPDQRDWAESARRDSLTADSVHRGLIKTLRAEEVVVTASESRGKTSASVINRQAMEHIQPSSFGDLLELLPGGMSKTPQLGNPGLIQLREARDIGNQRSSTRDYDIGSLGTAVMIDGVAVSTDANLQSMPGSYVDNSMVSRGLDTRTIPTDNIESVEIIRGIPSVEFGNLTNGLVNITRKQTRTPFTVRVKADEYGKLVSGGKGIDLGRGTILNLDVDYLNAKNDPRNTLQNYQRITGSARLSGRREGERSRFTWRTNLDYTASIDNQKADPDLMLAGDRYKSSYNKLTAGSTLDWRFKDLGILKSFNLTASLAQAFDRVEERKNVYLSRPIPLPTATQTGVNDAELLPFNYVADATLDGKPMNVFVKAVLGLGVHTGKVYHSIKVGGDWKYDKNFGNGPQYDLRRPLEPTNSNRPRAFKDIPAGSQLSFFVEDGINLAFGRHQVIATAGVRGLLPMNLDSRYTMHGKIYLDPRVNVTWNLPTIGSGSNSWKIELTAGIGQHTKMPTLAQLYPNKVYTDIVQLNYYPTNPDLRRVNLMTYVWDNTNHDLKPARNLKWEVRAGFLHRGMRFSATYFQERMNDGFRSSSIYHVMPYRKYDNTSVDPNSITERPSLDDFTYVDEVLRSTYGKYTNGSKIDKKGVEFQFSTPRFAALMTRITINGAWFRTTYSNSQPLYKSEQVNVGGQQLQYLGLYDWEDGSTEQRFNTNFTFDTYIEALKLTFSTTFQCLWFSSTQRLRNNGTPIAYVDPSGNENPFTEADKNDTYLRWLVHNYAEGHFDRVNTPFRMDVNFKATKHFGKYARLAMYVNRIFAAYPNYHRNGNLIRRHASPYFGMELNLTF